MRTKAVALSPHIHCCDPPRCDPRPVPDPIHSSKLRGPNPNHIEAMFEAMSKKIPG